MTIAICKKKTGIRLFGLTGAFSARFVMEIIECNVARGYFHAKIAKCKVADAKCNVARGYFHAKIAECKVADADYNAEFSKFYVAGGNFQIAGGIFHIADGVFHFKTGRLYLSLLIQSLVLKGKSLLFQLLKMICLPQKPVFLGKEIKVQKLA